MSHKIYTTRAIVCGSRANNTSDKSFLLFTREAGMLWATARSVREERSKQRFALQDFSLIKVSLVRGKGGWRIGSAESERNYFTSGHDTREARAATAAILRLLRQFLHGEIAQPVLFDDTIRALKQVGEDVHVVDVYTLRVLHQLGYVASSAALEPYLQAKEWWTLPSLPESAKASIEKAKQVSHL